MPRRERPGQGEREEVKMGCSEEMVKSRLWMVSIYIIFILAFGGGWDGAGCRWVGGCGGRVETGWDLRTRGIE